MRSEEVQEPSWGAAEGATMTTLPRLPEPSNLEQRDCGVVDVALPVRRVEHAQVVLHLPAVGAGVRVLGELAAVPGRWHRVVSARKISSGGRR